MENQFEVKQEGAILSIVLGEELSTGNAPALMEVLNQYRDKGIEKVVFDATALKYIASSGIRTIIFAKQKLGSSSISTPSSLNCAKDIYDVFEMTGIQDYISFVNQ